MELHDDRHDEDGEDDVVIDLRDRLAPYDHAAFRARPDGDEGSEWTPRLEYLLRG